MMTTTIKAKKIFLKPIHQFSEQNRGQAFMMYQGGLQESSNNIVYMKISNTEAVSLNDGITHMVAMDYECILVNIDIEYEIIE
jgi:hypothetical protein